MLRRRRAPRWGGVAGVAVMALLVLALVAPLIAPQDPADPLGFDPAAANRPPSLSWTYLLGADARGRSVLALLLWGSRVTLTIAVGAALLAAALGILLGLLSCWRGGRLALVVSCLMDLCQAAPPLLALLLLVARLGSTPAPAMLAVFTLTGWVAAARLTRATVTASWRALYVDAARALGVTTPRLVMVHLLPAVAAPLAAWCAAGAAMYVALEAGLDFLGLGLPQTTTSWGTALIGAQDALVAGNWWWMTYGGAALALATLSLGALARDGARGIEPALSRRLAAPHPSSSEAGDAVPALTDVWRAWQPISTPRPYRRGARLVAGVAVAILLGGMAVETGLGRRAAPPLPSAAALLRQVNAYPRSGGRAAAYIATATYAATEALVRGQQIPWAAWGPCPAGMAASRCARSDAQLWYSNAQGRIQAEGSTAICTARQTWILNPMAGLADISGQACGPLGPALGALGTTAGIVSALLPALRSGHARVLGSDAVAGRRCWLIALAASGRVCVDAASGLALRVERLDRAGEPIAGFTMSALSYGLDLAPQIFDNPIPGGRGPLVDGLTQPLADIQVADDMALFTALIATWLPAGLSAQIPTFDSFYDQTRGYAPQQRVRQAYTDHAGRVVLALIETLPGSAWDVTPPVAQGRRVRRGGQTLVEWLPAEARAAVVRRASDGTALLVSSRILSLTVLERVALGLR